MSVSEFYTNLTILRLPDPRTRQIKNAIVYTYVRARRSVVMALVAAAGIRTRRFNFCKIEKKKKSHGFKKKALPAHRLDGKKTAITREFPHRSHDVFIFGFVHEPKKRTLQPIE